MTYAQSNNNFVVIKTLLQPYCNRLSYQFQKSEYMKQDSFIDTSTLKYIKNDREWIAYKSSALKA